MNGEEGAQRGDLFQKRVIDLLLALQFDEISRFMQDLDFVGLPPTGYPDKSFIKPIFCPTGKIAVEATTDTVEGHIIKFKKVIEAYNANQNTADKITGGILVSDFKLNNKLIKETLDTQKIYLWDTRRLSFYSTKILLQKAWTYESDTDIQEVKVDEMSTMLHKLVEKLRSEPSLVNLSLFIENDEPLQVTDITKHLKGALSIVQKEYRLLFPLLINLQVHILNDWVKAEESTLQKSIYDSIEEAPEVDFVSKELKELIFGYGSGPWHPLLKCTEENL